MEQVKLRIVEPGVEFVQDRYTGTYLDSLPQLLEECGRVSHKSEGRAQPGSALPFLDRVAIRMGHESILEHSAYTVCMTMSRAASHQLVRHRIAAYTQESQRYCDYSGFNDPALQMIVPPSVVPYAKLVAGDVVIWDPSTEGQIQLWRGGPGPGEECHCLLTDRNPGRWLLQQARAYQTYLLDRADGVPAEDARYSLPNSAKTDVYTTFNLRTWRHVLELRTDRHAQWEIRAIMEKVLTRFLDSPVAPLFRDVGKRVTFSGDELAELGAMLSTCPSGLVDRLVDRFSGKAREVFAGKVKKALAAGG